MSVKITDVEFIFENIDFVVIPYEYVEHSRMELYWNDLYHLTDRDIDALAYFVEFTLKQEADVPNGTFRGDLSPDDETLFQRFMQPNGITQFRFHYDDGLVGKFDVQWMDSPGNEFANALQRVDITESGALHVVIGELPKGAE